MPRSNPEYRDSATVHRGELVAALLADYAEGITTDRLKKKYHVSYVFIGNVINGRSRLCDCGKRFYPSQEKSGYGSMECWNKALRGLNKPVE